MSTKIYPIGVQNFEKIRKEGYFYVDKTAMVYKLAKTGQYCFLSRPRRFGKSLLISTLEAYFQGKKELFAGLAIEHLETEWKQHPVLHLDLNAERYDRLENLNSLLNDSLCRWESVYGHSPSETTLSLRFKGVIRRASEQAGCPVAILIDEYDKPLLQTIGNETLQSEFRDALKAFYGVLKSVDRYICFALLTGVTKFSKVSVFSDLNNLRDISMSRLFDSICGITREELFSSLSAEIRELGATNDMTEEETRNSLQVWYDGYHFSEVGSDIYNPFSLLNTFAEMRFGSYWFETGTPTFLVELLKNGRYDLQRLTQETVSSDSLSGIDSMRDNPVPILYQSGYLTIKGYDAEFKLYHLGFPNREVEDGFTRFILPFYTEQ